MNPGDLFSLLPLIFVAGGSLVLMLAIAIRRDHMMEYGITLTILLLSFISLFFVYPLVPGPAFTIMVIDTYALFYLGLIIFATLVVTLLSYNYLEGYEDQKGEYYLLLLMGLFGAMVLVISNHFAALFLGLEILSVSLYGLIGYLREQASAIEAGVKYLILAAASSAFLLFGMAMVYTDLGTMHFSEIAIQLERGPMGSLTMLGVVMIFVAAGFKLALVPFHMWTPDIYQGASAPVTAFVATVSKGGIFGLIFRLFTVVPQFHWEQMVFVVSLVAIASMVAGNFLALLQSNVKRILAYSSIAHLGYLMVALLAGKDFGMQAGTFYLLAYFITILGAFGVVSAFSGKRIDVAYIDDFKGLFWKYPWLSFVFTSMLLSLAGIPLTAGFIGKFYLIAGGVTNELWAAVIVLALTSAVGLYYYLRIVSTMFKPLPEKHNGQEANLFLNLGWGNGLALAIVTVCLIIFGIFPQGMLNIIDKLVISI